VNAEGNEKHEEVSVVPPSNTVVDPWTVVVKSLQNRKIRFWLQYETSKCNEYLDAVVANTAMGTSGWSVELTSDTPFHPNRDAMNFYIFIQWCSEVILPVFVCICCAKILQ